MDERIAALSPEEALVVIALIEAANFIHNTYQGAYATERTDALIERCDDALAAAGFSAWRMSPIHLVLLEAKAREVRR